MERPDRDIPEPETLFAAALYLATNYAKTGCPMLCNLIMRQLACIRSHPSEAVPQALRDACGRLLAEWGRIGAERAAALHENAVAAGITRGRVH
ncbi:MAG: hypothetical protein HYY78_19270 [Betaproteobacteria bacterium]|nr:hypothetical protein [Betaproteobacteria bacterium]